METIMFLLNIAACALVWTVATSFYLRRGRPKCSMGHVLHVAWLVTSVGSFAAVVSALRGTHVAWWDVVFRLGVATVSVLFWLSQCVRPRGSISP